MSTRMTWNTPVKLPPITLPGKVGPERKHHCPEHDTPMSALKLWGKKSIVFECKEGCRLNKNQTNLK